MKAIECTKFGSSNVLQLKEIDKPTPKDNQILIKIVATTVTAGDCEIRSLRFSLMFRIFLRIYKSFKKLILGMELSGEVEAVGKEVTLFKKGDQVFAAPGFGANAEYICMAEGGPVTLKPGNMTFEEAAALPIGALNALHFLKRANIQQGQKVLIYGASGSIGTFAVQIAKHYGAEVTGICSATNSELVKSLGGDKVIDYTQEDFTQCGEVYDVILDTLGKISISQCKNLLTEEGFYLMASPIFSEILSGLWVSMTSRRKVLFSSAKHDASILISLKELVEAGKLKSVIDRSYPLEDMADAHMYVEKGHKKGNVVITMG